MTTNPLVTVVVPCYNHGQYLEEAIESVIAQTYSNLEIIIVNDGSSDNTVEVAKRCIIKDGRVRYVNLSENRGKWFALNTAIAGCKGTVVTCQDADDLALPDRIARQLGVMQATNSLHNLCGFHHCWSVTDVDSNKGSVKTDTQALAIAPEMVSKMVTYGFMTPGINHYFTGNFETAGTSAMFNKHIWDIGFRFNPPGVGMRIANSEDSDFNTRVTLALNNTSITAEQLYLYRRGTGTNNESR